MLTFTLLRPEFVREIQRTDPPQVAILTDASGSMQTRDVVSTNNIVARGAWIDSQNKRAFWTPLEEAGSAEPDELSRVITNNRLRRFLRITIAKFVLSSPDPDMRLDAVKQMLRALDAGSIELLRERAGEETNSSVSYEINTALALGALDEENESSTRLAAIDTLADRLHPEVHNRLSAILERDEDGSFIEGDEDVRRAAAEAVRGPKPSR